MIYICPSCRKIADCQGAQLAPKDGYVSKVCEGGKGCNWVLFSQVASTDERSLRAIGAYQESHTIRP